MQTSPLLASLAEGRPVFGLAHMIQDDTISETLREVALDFLLVDMQHVAITIETLQRTLIALQPSPLTVLVRPISNDPVHIGQVLDAGAHGVIVPMVNTGEDAARAVASAKYAPQGIRSWGSRRAYLGYGSREAFARNANDDAIVITQVETVEALHNLDAILDTPGLTGVIIGPADLAISMGHMHDRSHSDVEKAIQGVLDKCLERGVPFGYFGATLEAVQPWVERGGLIFNCTTDTLLLAGGVDDLTERVAAARRTAVPGGSVAHVDHT